VAVDDVNAAAVADGEVLHDLLDAVEVQPGHHGAEEPTAGRFDGNGDQHHGLVAPGVAVRFADHVVVGPDLLGPLLRQPRA
jgi:hypothetical protein